jgi:8-oxo-dGTP pyrophosphatase MutT (NUDIX family)
MIQKWPVLSTRQLADFRIFSVRTDLKRSPRTGSEHDFYVLQARNWVNVIAITPDHHLVMVEQYRHGSDTIELEIPGGVLEPGEPSPITGGQRELREETGYTGDSAELIGQIFPNPAIMANTCHTLLVRNARPTHPVEFDSCEDLRTHLIPVAELPALVASGRIQHALVVVALYHFDLWQRAQTPR